MNKITVKTVKTVIDLHKNGISNEEIAEKCGISIQSVEGIIETDNQNKVYIDTDKMSLWSISNKIDCESDNINGIANLLFCAGNSVTELNAEAMYALGNHLFSIYEKLSTLSQDICGIANRG